MGFDSFWELRHVYVNWDDPAFSGCFSFPLRFHIFNSQKGRKHGKACCQKNIVKLSFYFKVWDVTFQNLSHMYPYVNMFWKFQKNPPAPCRSGPAVMLVLALQPVCRRSWELPRRNQPRQRWSHWRLGSLISGLVQVECKHADSTGTYVHISYTIILCI